MSVNNKSLPTNLSGPCLQYQIKYKQQEMAIMSDCV